MMHARSLAMVPALLALLAIAAGCNGDDQRPSLIEEAVEARESALDTAAYTKPVGLHVDAQYLMGRRYDALDPEVVADQLGTEQSRETQPSWGVVEIVFEDRTIQLYRDEIFYIAYELPHPMDITTAMGVCGFPLRQPPSLAATKEERIVNYWNMRQISLMRVEDGSDLYDQIRIWKLRPQEVERTTVAQ